MDQEPRPAGSELGPNEPGPEGERTPEQIQAEIDATREQLGETVAAVAEKADVKAQARETVEEAKENVQDRAQQLFDKAKTSSPDSATAGVEQLRATVQRNPLPFAVGGALLVGFLIGRRRSE